MPHRDVLGKYPRALCRSAHGALRTARGCMHFVPTPRIPKQVTADFKPSHQGSKEASTRSSPQPAVAPSAPPPCNSSRVYHLADSGCSRQLSNETRTSTRHGHWIDAETAQRIGIAYATPLKVYWRPAAGLDSSQRLALPCNLVSLDWIEPSCEPTIELMGRVSSARLFCSSCFCWQSHCREWNPAPTKRRGAC
jgi:hypothetical protein